MVITASLDRLATVRTSSKPKAALQYAELGLPVLPTHSLDYHGRCTCNTYCDKPGAHPLALPPVASNNPEVVKRWWRLAPTANIVTPIGRNFGIFLLDIDRPRGMASLRKWEREHGQLPEPILRVRTGGGGEHRYYPMSSDGTHGIFDGIMAPDLVGMGDSPVPGTIFYAMLPPSKRWQRYRWL